MLSPMVAYTSRIIMEAISARVIIVCIQVHDLLYKYDIFSYLILCEKTIGINNSLTS